MNGKIHSFEDSLGFRKSFFGLKEFSEFFALSVNLSNSISRV